ncbi:hypothetical protein CU097_014236 [Rhizopus azygosporus]|uniref:Uncharacterized protein n=1 Tax=Rhizopus azygosporus TaxID=86630 RepID=A0A367KGU0_RHIAZ|nr:hypothetical protein CU097_014236 [Rhizopus azygosporus]
MANELFGNVAENRTTLEVEVEPTTMVVGTTDNSNVGETKTRNMFTRPGFFSWIMNRNQKRIPNQTVFTIEQFEEIVRQSLQQFKLEEANRVRGAALSTSVKEELGLIFETNNKDDLRQYKKNVHRYDDGPWTTTKTINKEFILKLKQWKTIEQARRLAIYSFASAEYQSQIAYKHSIDALRVSFLLKHLQTRSSDKVIEDVHAEHLDIFHLEKDSQLEDFWALGTGAQ